MQSKRKFIAFLTIAIYIVWTVLLVGILAIICDKIYSYAKYVATQKAITSTNKDLAYRSWVASHGGVYVPVDKRTPPSPYLAKIKDRDFHAIGKDFTLMNPAYTLSQMMRDYSKLYGTKTHITSKKLLNPKNRPDTWETLALEKIEQTRKNYISFDTINGEKYLRLMKPLVTKKSCLKCHAFQGYKVGDIRGGVSTSIPMKSLYKDALNNSLLVSFLFLLIWLIGIIFISIFSKKLYRYLDEKEQLYEEYIYGLVNVVEKRDAYTAGHSARVAKYARMIAKEMRYSEQECDKIYRAGMLHDIGKIAIPDSVFLKPTKLSSSEYKLIQTHVEISYDMLKNISIFNDIKEIIRDRHEHYDGSGYPRGLRGEDMPVFSQILALADAFDAMTTDRIYKGRKTIKEALKEIVQLSAKQFHPKVAQYAVGALKDVEIDRVDNIAYQKVDTLLEGGRLSYFYRDLLTGAFNRAYLDSNMKNILEHNFIIWISLKNFHSYNKTNGWSKGDKLLIYIVEEIENLCKKDKDQIYRFYGDNFFILLDDYSDVAMLKDLINKIALEKNCEFNIKVSEKENIKNAQECKVLEDVLKKLF